ncbi:hypothetical protein [Sulfolobus acidocaldarius]|uniref:Conserved protein n=4 Tax=Sulfolobus acidocaldarius TaxID=2285 RepID=Q4JC57_SULAC|nr:hypothetical protein [Sulfolobus acidocaldarius]AAY79622.1 conserved protein [Sulfolobus acidocaldarius DSM 639]AGE70176.1 hypothetical protein SacN8_00975 [Sulfolobus acidocaldarius N8]AGE72451.1 hypothetical protein SacRon12I_00975 [Sulfolobus acidocaldarius Ron12/I]ALU29414.1 hypothetical protein ATY89_05270 [Sulfolobus acidocaldarius]ALU32142.1 hypothetical protein ATZ20_08290 [Sulfolobus acidocaldarius]
MSELDLILNRKKTEQKVEASEQKVESRQETSKSTTQKLAETKTSETQEKVNENDASKSPREDLEEVKSSPNSNSEVKVDNIKGIMKKFIDRDPKIGIWSYPSFLVLQYLYHTVPGFKMSKIAKDALERGLREIYPDLFRIAEEVTLESKKS